MNNEIIFYTTPDGNKKVEVVLQDETAWLTQKAIAGLFDVQRPAITKHLESLWKSQSVPFWNILPWTGKTIKPHQGIEPYGLKANMSKLLSRHRLIAPAEKG